MFCFSIQGADKNNSSNSSIIRAVDADIYSKLLGYYCGTSEKVKLALLGLVSSWRNYESTVGFSVFSRGLFVFAIFDGSFSP
jgi:hypothetical protein